MSAALKILEHTLAAMDRIAEPKPRVRFERNPLDFCQACGVEDKHGFFRTTYRNGREIALCDACERC